MYNTSPVHALPAPGLFGRRGLVLPCNLPVEHLQAAESHMAVYGYQAVLYDPERPEETALPPYDWVYVLEPRRRSRPYLVSLLRR